MGPLPALGEGSPLPKPQPLIHASIYHSRRIITDVYEIYLCINVRLFNDTDTNLNIYQ